MPDPVTGCPPQKLCYFWTFYSTRTLAAETWHESLYCSIILRWISTGLKPSLLKKCVTDRCSNVVNVNNGGGHLCTDAVSFLCVAATYCHLLVILWATRITPANCQINHTTFWDFIALLWFLFESPSAHIYIYITQRPKKIDFLCVNNSWVQNLPLEYLKVSKGIKDDFFLSKYRSFYLNNHYFLWITIMPKSQEAREPELNKLLIINKYSVY